MLLRVLERFAFYESSVTRVIYISNRSTVLLASRDPRSAGSERISG